MISRVSFAAVRVAALAWGLLCCVVLAAPANAVDGVAGSVREAIPAPPLDDSAAPKRQAAGDLVKSITIRAPRDMGYFQGDLVKVDIDLIVSDGATIEMASLPHPGPIAYWLDLRTIDVTSREDGPDRRYTLKLLYQDFYDALDARPQEIPTFPVTVRKGSETFTADVPAWTIGVSSLREVAPPVKDDPKDYLRADQSAPLAKTDTVWTATGFVWLGCFAAFVLLTFDRAWWPFHKRPARIFGQAARRLRNLHPKADDEAAYLEALLLLHRGIDQTAGRRILGDDVPTFLSRHRMFAPLADSFARFFAASRQAFFGSDPAKAREALGLDSVKAFARQLAAIERTKP